MNLLNSIMNFDPKNKMSPTVYRNNKRCYNNLPWKVKIINAPILWQKSPKESTLAAHPFQNPNVLFQQQHEPGSKLGMTAYPRFYEKTQGSAKFKTYADFSTSPIIMHL